MLFAAGAAGCAAESGYRRSQFERLLRRGISGEGVVQRLNAGGDGTLLTRCTGDVGEGRVVPGECVGCTGV